MRDPGLVLFAYVATAWLHAAIAFLAVRGLVALRVVRGLAAREAAWRFVMLAPFVTAAVQLGAQDFVAGQRWSVDAVAGRIGAVTVPRDESAAPPRAPIAAHADALTRSPVAAIRHDDATTAGVPRVSVAPASSAARATHSGPVLDRAAVRASLALAGWAWLAIALFVVARYAALAARASGRAARLPAIDDAGYRAAAARIARALGTPPVALHRDDARDGPLALAPRQVCVPGWMIDALGPAQRDAMLAHEIAHHARRDPAWRFAQACAAAVLPLRGAAQARRQLDDLAELACDARAAALDGNGRALAECLALCARQGLDTDRPAFAVAMAHSRSPLVERVRRLLEDDPMPQPFLDRARGALLVVFAAAAAVVLPGFSRGEVDPVDPGDGTRTEARVTSAAPGETEVSRSSWNLDLGFGDRTRIRVKRDGYAFALDVAGDYAFNDAETDLASLEDEMRIEETRDGVTREITFEKTDGGITREYRIDGDAQPFDDGARAWLAAVIPQVYRQTGIQAKQRVARLHARGGADAVLAEIDRIDGDNVRGQYLRLLFEHGALAPPQLARATKAIETMGSDYERREVLVAALGTQSLDVDHQQALLGIAAALGSDYERREVLVAAAPKLATDARVTDAWFDALDAMGSDYERRVALDAMVARAHTDPSLLARALASTDRFGSDYEHRTALVGTARLLPSSDANVAAYARSAKRIGSDYERREALAALIDAVDLGVDGALAVLDATEGMGSDYEIGQVLASLAARMPADERLVRRYRAVARQLGDHERGQAERALDRFEL